MPRATPRHVCYNPSREYSARNRSRLVGEPVEDRFAIFPADRVGIRFGRPTIELDEVTMRSDEVKKGADRAPHRSLFYAMGYTPEELNQPLIGVCNAQNEIVPGHYHLDQIARAVKDGVRMAGGTPIEFPAIGVDDGIAMGHVGMHYPLATRELIADSIEAVAMAHRFDALVLVTNCDKITPAMLMAAARLNIPAIIISGGPMLAGRRHGRDIDLFNTFEAIGQSIAGTLDEAEMAEIEAVACPGCGSCAGMFTANTMNCLTEVLGMGLPGNGTIPAVSGRRIQLAKRAGMKIMELLEKNIRPLDIMTREAFENAIAVDMAIGGSTNTVLHLPAIAHEAGFELELEAFDRIAAKTPYLVSLSPAGKYHIADLDEVGGIPAVMKRLTEKDLLRTDLPTVTGKTVAENLASVKIASDEMVRPFDRAHRAEGGIVIMRGTLAPNGAVVKAAAVAQDALKRIGRARVFNSEEEAFAAMKAHDIKAGDAVIIRYEGPKGGPGMREMLIPTSVITGMGLEREVTLITDGRFSGASRGAAIGHVSPEAAEGGPLAIVRDGDQIEIDIPAKKLNLLVSDEEIRARLSDWRAPKPKIQKGYLARYAALVTSAATGAVLKVPGE